MTDTPIAEVVPCPFCGHKEPRAFVNQYPDGPDSFGIQCCGGDCAITGPERDTREEAITAWNTRAQSDVERELLGALAEIADIYEVAWDEPPPNGQGSPFVANPYTRLTKAAKIARAAIARATGGGA